MQIITFKRPTVIFISLVLIITFGVTTSMAQQKIKIGGKMTCAIFKTERINPGDTEDHTVALMQYEGTGVSIGENNFMDGGQVTGMTYGDLVKGNGPHQGYGNTSLNGDVVFWKHEGKTTTTLSPKGKPVVAFEGSITFTKGAGKYENIQGGGTYKGKYISKTIWINEWEGEYFIKK
jgi:hypothetical protein